MLVIYFGNYIVLPSCVFREMADYKETGWSASSELEADLAALEANLDQQFGEPTSDQEGRQTSQGIGVNCYFAYTCKYSVC